MSNRLVKYLFITLLLQPFAAYAQKTTVSVMDLNITTGVGATEMIMLTDKLLNDLVTTEVYQVVDRSKRDETLKELKFQQSGACDQGTCLVEAGQLLGVQKMIGGTIGKLGLMYSLQLRMLDVKTGKIDKAFSKSYSGDISLMLDGMREAAYYFSGLNRQAVPVAQTAQAAKAPADTALSTLQAKADMERKKGAGDRKKTLWTTISPYYGKSFLKAEKFDWSEEDSFSRVYEGIEWEPGQHLGLEISPKGNRIFSRKGSSFKLNITMSLYYQNNKSASSLVTLTDENQVTNVTTTTTRYLPEKSFTLTKVGLLASTTTGYWFMLSPGYALEPYGGVGIKEALIFFSGTEVNDKDFSGLALDFGFPVGARFYMRHLFLGFEYSYFIASWNIEDWTPSGSVTEKIKFSQESASHWNATAGFIF